MTQQQRRSTASPAPPSPIAPDAGAPASAGPRAAGAPGWLSASAPPFGAAGAAAAVARARTADPGAVRFGGMSPLA